VPQSANNVVQEARNKDDTENIQRIDVATGKVLTNWHVAALLSWVSLDGKWATSYSGDVFFVPTGKLVTELKYVPSNTYAPRWNVDYGYLSSRMMAKQIPTYLVVGTFLLFGAFGYRVCRASWFGVIPVLGVLVSFTVWWLRELF